MCSPVPLFMLILRLALVINVSVSSLALAGPREDTPVELLALENSRAAFLTGRVEFSVRSNLPDGSWWDVPRFYTASFAGEDYMLEDRGDREGVVWRAPDGEPHPDVGRRPYRWLLHDGKQWGMRDGSLLAEVQLVPTDVIDARCFGLTTGLPQGVLYHTLIWGTRERAYEAKSVDGLREVVARNVDSDWEVRWLLDPQRGWNPVRVTVTSGGKLLREARTSLKKFGDVWFPEVYEIYEHTYKEAKEARYVIEVFSASFNQPGHPLRFTPEDIGVEVGTNIEVYKDHSSRERVRVGWDGNQLVPLQQLFERIRAGELKKGPRFVAASERAGAMGRGVDSITELMERYTRAFIRKYNLNDEQAQKAMSILKDCRQRAESYGSSKKHDYERIRAEVSAAYEDPCVSPTERAQKVEQLKQEMYRLEKPLFKIHYWELVPRLNKLPTRAQRQAAAERELAQQKKEAADDRKREGD